MTDNSNSKPRAKDNGSFRIIQQVRSIFLSGRKVTAKEINFETNSNDARRVISILRNKEGWNIVDCRMPDGCKLYWLREHDDVEPYFKTAAELAAEVRKMVYDNLTKTEPTK